MRSGGELLPELEWTDQEWKRSNTIALPWCGWTGEHKRCLPLFTLNHLFPGYERSCQSKFLQPIRGCGGAGLHQGAGEGGCQAKGYRGDYTLQVVGGTGAVL